MSPSEEFERSVWRLLDGRLDEDEFRQLESRLAENEDELDRFVEMVDLHGVLMQKLSLNVSGPSVLAMDEVLRRQRRRYFIHSSMGAAAVLLLVGVMLKLVWLKPVEPLLTFRHSDDAVLRVTHAREAGSSERGDSLEKGSRLQLSQGGVELTLKSGVVAMVRAPADLTLHEENLLYQSLGMARYVVPKSAVGFQVKTPDLMVTDLGTDFGVISSPDNLDQVHLFKGKVEVQNQWGLRKKELLAGVESRVAGPAGRLRSIDSSPELFMTTLEDEAPYIHFSFDRIENGEFEVTGNHPDADGISASLQDATKPEKAPGLTEGKLGNALEMLGYGGCVQTNWQGISGTAPRSVAFWVKLPTDITLTKQRGFLTWGDTRVDGGKFELIVNRNAEVGQQGAVRFDCGKGYVIGGTDLYDGKWHHVAVVLGGVVDPASGMQVQLYVDGELEEVTGFLRNEPDTTAGVDEGSWMSVGRYLHSGSPNDGYLIGTMDELYVFAGVLTQSDIQQVMKDEW